MRPASQARQETPPPLLTGVEVAATYKLHSVNRTRRIDVFHRLFGAVQFDLTIVGVFDADMEATRCCGAGGRAMSDAVGGGRKTTKFARNLLGRQWLLPASSISHVDIDETISAVDHRNSHGHFGPRRTRICVRVASARRTRPWFARPDDVQRRLIRSLVSWPSPAVDGTAKLLDALNRPPIRCAR